MNSTNLQIIILTLVYFLAAPFAVAGMAIVCIYAITEAEKARLRRRGRR